MAAIPLLTGKASILYTFYPPLMAHPTFYIGATLLVVGSWIWCLEMIMSVITWNGQPGKVVPLAMYGTPRTPSCGCGPAPALRSRCCSS